MTTETKYEHKYRRRSIFWPLLLIAAGVMLILANLGLLEGDSWALVARLWPLIFIVSGIDSIWKGEGWAGAVLMTGLGVVFLLANFGYLQMGALELLLRLWPVFLVALGLDLIFRGTSAWLSILGGLVAIGLVGGIFWFAATSPVGAAANLEEVNQPLQNVRSAVVQIDPAVSDLQIRAGSGAGELITGQVALSRGETLNDQYRASGQSATFTLSSNNDDVAIPFFNFGRSNHWDLNLNGEIPLEIAVDQGIGSAEIDLSELNVSNLTADLGIGRIEVILPEGARLDGRLKSAIGETVVRVPRDATVRIRLDKGITGVSYPDGYREVDNMIYSPGAQGSQADINLDIEQPIGSVEIVYIR